MIRRLIVPLTAAVVTFHAGHVLAQTPFPAPLPNQSAAPANASPFPPVNGVAAAPVQSAALQGLDSLLSIVQMPGGVPVGTLAIGKPGATNAALLTIAILSNSRPELRNKLRAFRETQTQAVLQERLP